MVWRVFAAPPGSGVLVAAGGARAPAAGTRRRIWLGAREVVRAGSGGGEFGFQQLFGERPAGLFVLVECLGVVTVVDGVGEDPG